MSLTEKAQGLLLRGKARAQLESDLKDIRKGCFEEVLTVATT